MTTLFEVKDGKVTNTVFVNLSAHAYDNWVMASNHRRRVALIRMGWSPERVIEAVPMFHPEGTRSRPVPHGEGRRR